MQQALNDAEQQLRAAEADYNSLKARLDADTLNQRAQAAIVRADYQNAQTEREMNEGLAEGRPGLEPGHASSRWSAPNRWRRATRLKRIA